MFDYSDNFVLWQITLLNYQKVLLPINYFQLLNKLLSIRKYMSEKKVDLVNSSEVQVMKEKERDFIDIDVNRLEEQKFYRVEYEGDVYAIEKLSDDKIVFYEVVE